MYRTYRGKPQNGNPVVAPQSGPLALQPLPELPLEDGVSVWTAQSLDALRRKVQMGDKEQELLQKNLFRTIDILGARSQRAQGVNEPLTTVSRLHESNTYRLYLLVHQYQGLGILKVGVKKLFISHPSTKQLVELDPLCVLDFYVDESVQRKGYGNQIYREMLENEKTRPELLAIDRPSPKFLGFMKKHYSLDSFTPQGNNFVVFHRFFDNTTVTERGQLRRIADSNAAAGPTATVAADPRHLKGSPGAGAREDETGLGRGLASAGSPPALGMLTPTLPIHPTGGASAPPVSHAPTSWHTDMVRPMPMPNCGPTYTQPQALLSPSPYNNYNSGARPLPVLRRGPPPLASTAPVYPPRAAPQAGYRQVPRARAPPQAYTVPSRPRFPTANAPSPPLIYRPGHILAAGGLPQLHSQPTRGYPKSMGGSTWPQHPLSGIQAVGEAAASPVVRQKGGRATRRVPTHQARESLQDMDRVRRITSSQMCE